MTKWRYGLAHFDGISIEAHGEYMNDMPCGAQSIPQFLQDAGEKGWELCTVIPGKTDKPHDRCIIFKRPA